MSVVSTLHPGSIPTGAMGFFEFRVSINCPLAAVFAVYTDTDHWQWCTILSQVRWVRGKPWEEGSRMRLETSGTIPTAVDQVLLHFEPQHSVAYISHFSGITLETRVSFRPVSDHETEIHARMEFVGVASRAFGFAIEPVIERSTNQFFADLKRECERTDVANSARPRRQVAKSLSSPQRQQSER